MKIPKLLLVCCALFASGCRPSIDGDRVFRSEEHKVSFRYPSSWDPVRPQMSTTLVMLHARDGSFATCNLSMQNADRSTTDEMDESYWKTALSKAFPTVAIRRVHFFDAIGGRRAIIEYDFDLRLPAGEVPASSLTMATIRNGKRYMLVLNTRRARIDSLRPAFELMAGTLAFDMQ